MSQLKLYIKMFYSPPLLPQLQGQLTKYDTRLMCVCVCISGVVSFSVSVTDHMAKILPKCLTVTPRQSWMSFLNACFRLHLGQ